MRITQGYIYYIHTLRFNHFVFTTFTIENFLGHSHTHKKRIWVVRNKEAALLRVKNIKDPKNVENNREVFSIYPHCFGSLFAPKRAAPRRRPQPFRLPPRPNYATQNRGSPQRRRQQGGFLTDSVNFGFDEQSTPKKRTKQKGGSVLPLNKIPWVKRVHLS